MFAFFVSTNVKAVITTPFPITGPFCCNCSSFFAPEEQPVYSKIIVRFCLAPEEAAVILFGQTQTGIFIDFFAPEEHPVYSKIIVRFVWLQRSLL